MATAISPITVTTPMSTDTSVPSTPSMSFRLNSIDSMSSLSGMSMSGTPPILRDFQEMTLSLTDEDEQDHELNSMDSLFVFCNNKNTKNANHQYNIYDDGSDSAETPEIVDLTDDENDENPFLMGLAINIPTDKSSEYESTFNKNDIIIPDIESCDDEDEYTNNYFVEDFDADRCSEFDDDDIMDTNTYDIDRKFMMKKYKYIQNIGIGAFGIVDKVFHRAQNKYVAIKQSRSIGDEVLKQFCNEIMILQQFADCEYVIDIIDYGRNVDANQICIGLEYIDIGSLCNIKSYTIDQIKYISKCVLIALQTLHSKLYVHNDIKPDNILISSQGDVKLIDFGCTMKMNDYNEPLTKSIGSIRYLSFEKRFMSPIQYNTKSDIYSFGITISELFNGEHIRNKTGYNHYFATSSPKLKNNDNVCFNDFVSKCIEQDPEKRFSATQLLQHPFLNSVPEKVEFAV